MEVQQGEAPNFLAPMAPEKIDQPMRCRDIGPHRMWAAATIMGEVAAPARRKRPRRMSFPL